MVEGELPVGGVRPRPGSASSLGREALARLRSAVPHDAIAEIMVRAKRTRIVILNEARTSPRDRAFGMKVAPALRPLDYRILGADAFFNDVDSGRETPAGKLARDGFFRRLTGYYTRDPVFAAFIRAAMAIGYVPAAYEMRFDQFPSA